jgi:hypothetical protein
LGIKLPQPLTRGDFPLHPHPEAAAREQRFQQDIRALASTAMQARTSQVNAMAGLMRQGAQNMQMASMPAGSFYYRWVDSVMDQAPAILQMSIMVLWTANFFAIIDDGMINYSSKLVQILPGEKLVHTIKRFDAAWWLHSSFCLAHIHTYTSAGHR